MSLLNRQPTQAAKPATWPFPPATGPVPWTPKQEVAYKRKQREQAGEALL